MSKLTPGIYTYGEILKLANFDLKAKAESDFRRVTVGGLHFDDPNNVFVVPESASRVDISLDGSVEESLDVDTESGKYRHATELPKKANRLS